MAGRRRSGFAGADHVTRPWPRLHAARFLPMLLAGALVTTAAAARAETVETPWGAVPEPSLPGAVCATLTATLTPIGGRIDALDQEPARSQPDTRRIQAAIDTCPSGRAVRLVRRASGASGFLSGPLRLKSGVTLWIDKGVTLYASRNPADYDTGRGACGTATQGNARACRPFILADGTTGSGIVGEGAIDGRGGSLLTGGPNAGRRSWWDVAYQNKTQGLHRQNPSLIVVRNGFDFTLYRVAVLNAPNFHIVTADITGITAWGIRILTPSSAYTRPGYACPPGSTPDRRTPATCFTPETVKNTDGFDPGDSSRVLLAHAFISDGDDDVAVKSHGTQPSHDLAFIDNHFYYGHGMSIGSETDSGLGRMVVRGLSIDGFDSPQSVGLRIKSDASRGGPVRNVTYSRICMRNVRRPLVFDAFYGEAGSGNRYPSFAGITVHGLRDLGSRQYGGGILTFAGAPQPIGIRLDDVVLDGGQPGFARGHNGGPASPAATHFTLGPGPVSFATALRPSGAADVTVTGTMEKAVPLDCSTAFIPFHSVLPEAPF